MLSGWHAKLVPSVVPGSDQGNGHFGASRYVTRWFTVTIPAQWLAIKIENQKVTKAMITSVRDKKWQMVPPKGARERMDMVPPEGARERM